MSKEIDMLRVLPHSVGAFLLVSLLFLSTGAESSKTRPIEKFVSILYGMPEQSGPHSATWLQWPHNYGWDRYHTKRYDPIWIAMTKALAPNEQVNIVVYNQQEQDRVVALLSDEGVGLDSINFYQWKTDDVWVRDNGPVFVVDAEGKQVILNWE